MKKNKIILIVILAVLVIGGIVTAAILLNRSEPEVVAEATPAPKKKKVTAPLNIIPVEQRPVMALRPFVSNGKNLAIEVANLPLPAESAEYEIEYTIGSATAKTAAGRDTKVPDNEASEGVQGFIGELDIASLPAQTEKMLGSCSAGGACIYHAGITDGKVTLRFAASPNYALQSSFTYFEKDKVVNETLDGKFNFSGNILAKETDFLVVEMMGLPAGLPSAVMTTLGGDKGDEIKASAYGIYFSGTAPSGEVSVTFVDAPRDTKIAAYANGKWEILNAQATETGLTAVAPLAEIYALIDGAAIDGAAGEPAEITIQ